MQDLDAELASILSDLVEFLESLSSVQLPDSLTKLRELLLSRLKRSLGTSAENSSEAYLDMSRGGRGSVPASTSVNQDFYETFEGSSDNSRSLGDSDYSFLTADQAKSKSTKWGQLTHYRDQRKIPFVFGQSKPCWAGLCGEYMLIYASEKDSRPYLLIVLQGYRARPAPNLCGREVKRTEAAFEIFCPGDKTFNFVANSMKDMDEWIDAVEKLSPSKKQQRDATFIEILDLCSSNSSVGSERKSAEQMRSRRLPSPPRQTPNQDSNYEDEGLYHKIEDVPAYDDVLNVTKSEKSPKSTKSSPKRSFLDRVRNRKETSKKDEKKSPTAIGKVEALSLKVEEAVITKIEFDQVPRYDGVSSFNEEQYLSPPPPRPIYSPTEEIYDDIGYYQNEALTKSSPPCSPLYANNETEHYQVPKPNNRPVLIESEQLYDDVGSTELFKSGSRVGPTDDMKIKPLNKLINRIEHSLNKSSKLSTNALSYSQ